MARLNYLAQTGAVHFASLQSTPQVEVPVLNDGLVEGGRTLQLVLDTPSSGAVSLDTVFRPNDLQVKVLALQSDGSWIIAGLSTAASSDTNRTILRFQRHPDGSWDLAAATLAVTNRIESFQVNSMLIQPDGKLIIGGAFDLVNKGEHADLECGWHDRFELQPGFRIALQPITYQ